VAELQDLLSISGHQPPDAAESSWLRLLLLSGRCHRLLAHRLTAPDEATATEILVLACLVELGEICQQSELVERLGCSAGHVSGIVERLRQRGWMTADRAAGDRRRQLWRITPAGRAALAGVRFRLGAVKLVPALRDLLAQLDSDLSQADGASPETVPSERRSSA